MKAKKLLLAMLFVLVLAGSLCAAEHKVGFIGFLSTPEKEELRTINSVITDTKADPVFFTPDNEVYLIKPAIYDSLQSMQMALNSGEVDQIMLPEAVGEYLMKFNNDYIVAAIFRGLPGMYISLALGFRKGDDPSMLNKFNEAIKAMKDDGTMAVLREKYITEADTPAPKPVTFEKFPDSKTIQVAVTGALPPIDYVNADGTPAGFNTAMLAEISKRLHVNIELVNTEANARAASLASKRVDAVFWFMLYKGNGILKDAPDDVVLSEPYYSWNINLFVKLKGKK